MRTHVLGALAGCLLAVGCSGYKAPATASASSTAASTSSGGAGTTSSTGTQSGSSSGATVSSSGSHASASGASSGGATVGGIGGIGATGSSGTTGTTVSASSVASTASTTNGTAGTTGAATGTTTAGVTTGGTFGTVGTSGTSAGTSSGPTGTTSSSGTTGISPGQICSSCTSNSDCFSNNCNLSLGSPGFCDAAAGFCTANADCAPSTCSPSLGTCDCVTATTGGTSAGSGSTGSTGTSGVGTSGSSGTTGGTTGGPGYIRVVDTLPDGFAVDFCLRSTGRPNAPFTGPILKNLGANSGINYGQASYYVAMPADCYDVRVVSPGSQDCSQPFFGLQDFVNAGCASSGAHTSLVVRGTAFSGYPLGLTQLDDDIGPTNATDTSLRFFNAMNLSSASSADFGTLDGSGTFTALLDGVAYTTATPQTAVVDANQYLQSAPFTATIAVRGGGNLLVTAGPVSAIGGAAYSLFGLGLDNSAPARLLVCRDDGTLGLAVGAGLANCQTLP